MKMETPVAVMFASDIIRQNMRANTNEWKERARKSLRDSVKPYLN